MISKSLRPTLAAGMWMLWSGGWLFSTWTQYYQDLIFHLGKIFHWEKYFIKNCKVFTIPCWVRVPQCRLSRNHSLIFVEFDSRGRIHRHYLSSSALITTLRCLHFYSSVLAQLWTSHNNKVLQLLLCLHWPETGLGMRLSCWTGGGGGETGVQILSCLGPELHWENVKPGEQGLQ